MLHYCLRVEGVNFSETLFDTNDLSVIRGSSLLLERVGDHCSAAIQAAGLSDVTPIYSGASHAGFDIGSDSDLAKMAKRAVLAALNKSPYCHLSFVVDIGEGDSPEAALKAAERKNKLSQFQQWTIPDSSVKGALRQDALDGVRGATISDSIKGPLSPSTHARLEYGRKHRKESLKQGLSDALLAKKIEFCDSFQDLVQEPPSGLSRSAENKIAVIHLDGDRFGTAAKAVGTKEFSAALGTKFAAIRQRIVSDALAAEEAESQGASSRLRMEILVWGGDDIFIVIPAWRSFLFLEGFYDELKDWTVGGVPLSFTAGVVIAQVKTPVRTLTALADCAVRESKAVGARGAVTFDIFESVSVPSPDQLGAHRLRYSKRSMTSNAMALPADQLCVAQAKIRSLKVTENEASLGRSQIYKLLAADDPVSRFAEYRERVVAGNNLSDEALVLPSVPDTARGLGGNLFLIAQLWDYVNVSMLEGAK